MPATRKRSRTSYASSTRSVRARRASAYRTLMRKRPQIPLNVNPKNIYRYAQSQYPTYLTKQGLDPAGTFLSSNSQCVILGTPAVDAQVYNTHMVGGVIQFRLNNLPGANPYLEMYDQYRIVGAKITFTPQHNTADYYTAGVAGGSAQNFGGNPIPQLTICRDLDDTNVPADEYEILQRQDSHTYRMDKPISLWMRPRVRMINQLSGVAGSTGTVSGTGYEWIDVGSSGTIYPGFKFFLRHLFIPAAATMAIRVDCKLTLEFKNVR